MTFNEDHALETYKSLISIAIEAQRAFLYLNGGAIVALIAYFGQNKLTPAQAQLIYCPVLLFIIGLAIISSSFVTSYLTQLALYNETISDAKYKGPKHIYCLWLTIFLSLASLICFSLGAWKSIPAIIQ